MARKRTWTQGPHPETGEVDRDELAQRLYDAAGLLMTIGGNVTMAPIRVQVQGPVPDDYRTVGVIFQHDAYAPSVTMPVPETGDEPEEPQEPTQEAEEPEAEVLDEISTAEPQAIGS